MALGSPWRAFCHPDRVRSSLRRCERFEANLGAHTLHIDPSPPLPHERLDRSACASQPAPKFTSDPSISEQVRVGPNGSFLASPRLVPRRRFRTPHAPSLFSRFGCTVHIIKWLNATSPSISHRYQCDGVRIRGAIVRRICQAPRTTIFVETHVYIHSRNRSEGAPVLAPT